MTITRFRVAPAHAGRADKAVLAQFPGASRKRVAALFERGAVCVRGRPLRKGDQVRAGTAITVAEAPVEDADLRPVPEPERPLVVIYDDDAVVAANKPAGMASQPLKSGERATLANALVARYPECVGVGQDPREAGLVHRLDIGTSGVLVAARTKPVWDTLRRAFAAGTVHKVYWALVASRDISDGGCAAPLVHRGKRMAVVAPEVPGRVAGNTALGTPVASGQVASRDAPSGNGLGRLPAAPKALSAATRWRVLDRLGPYTLVACTARTGRMHQIRVHLAHAGAPIVGDRQYGGPVLTGGLAGILKGHFLHARAIAFPHPHTGRRLHLEAPLPADRRAVLDALSRT